MYVAIFLNYHKHFFIATFILVSKNIDKPLIESPNDMELFLLIFKILYKCLIDNPLEVSLFF